MFAQAAEFVKENWGRIDKQTQLSLYTLYKQSKDGDLPPTFRRPSQLSVLERAKYDARVNVRGMDASKAQQEYVRTVVEANVGFSLHATPTPPPSTSSPSSSSLTVPSSSPATPAPPAAQVKTISTYKQLLENVFVDSGCLRTFMINFLLVYNARFGVALLGRIAGLATTSPKQLLSMSNVLDENHLKFREEGVRMGLFVATFGAVFVAMRRALHLFFHDLWYASALSGATAGALCFHWMEPSWHRTLALYSATRAAQCFYNFSKSRGYFHFWGSSWPHGDSLLFALGSAQVMYSYVMRPSALPASYYHFIRKQGPLPETVLQSVRDSCRGNEVNTKALFDLAMETAGPKVLEQVKQEFDPKLIPVRALHLTSKTPVESAVRAFINVSRQIFGVYFSLALAPQVVLHFQKFIRQPGQTVWHSLLSAIQSSIFLSTFCGGYQFLIVCLQRPLLQRMGWKDHKLWYWVAGFIASWSILIERKSRRSELALYAFPRGFDALYFVLNDRKLVSSVPQGEMLLFSAAMGVLTFFLANDPDCLSPAVVSVLGRFLPKDAKKTRVEEVPPDRPDSTVEFGQEIAPPTPRMVSLGGSSLVS